MHIRISASPILVFLLMACGGTTGSNTVPDGADSGDSGLADTADTMDTDVADDTPDAADAPPDADDGGVDVADAEPDVPAPSIACEGLYRPPSDVPMMEEDLAEASGIIASRRNPDVLWLHNDSGDGPRLFAIGTDGTALGRLTLDGADANDWEDISAGACPDGNGECLWVGDVGDNLLRRDDAALYAVREPLIDGPFGEMTTNDFVRFPVGYGDEAVNVEALLVAADASAFWMLEKVDGDTARIFHFAGPLSEDELNTFEVAGQFNSPGVPIRGGKLITGADLHPTGTRVLVRVYTGSFEYRLEPDMTPADLGAVEPITVAPGPLSEGQGEAIAYTRDGIHVWTISETQEPPQPLHFYQCPD